MEALTEKETSKHDDENKHEGEEMSQRNPACSLKDVQ